MQIASGQGRSFRDGIFSAGDMIYPYQEKNQQAYADGSLGSVMTSGAGSTYRDGIFSRETPQYGFAASSGNMAAYSDGSLGMVLSDNQKTMIGIGGIAILAGALYMVYGKK